jgi:hypothetical protein
MRFALLVLVALFVSGCDVDLFGTDAKRITRGYFLSLTDGPDHCALKSDRDFITPELELIGWRKPLLLCQTDGKRWIVVATDTGQQTIISDAERRESPLYNTIEVGPAIEAWKSLSRRKPVW